MIDLGIDSDGVVNGHVLTSDIDWVEELILYDLSFSNLIGLEDFASLKTLDLSGTSAYYTEPLDLTVVPTLENFYIDSSRDNVVLEITDIDLSNNPNLKEIRAHGNWSI